jgi:ATP-dependent helicase Lhr and Lhr-like helicase
MIKKKEQPDAAEDLNQILHPIVKKWFDSRFPSYSLPQLFGVLEIHSRKNILVSAPTGATKTLTGFLAILNDLVDSHEKGILQDKVYCVYVSPLKALNEDIRVNLIEPLHQMEEIAGKKLNIRVAVRTGDTTAQEKSRMLRYAPHILITTPESLAILLCSSKFSAHLQNVEWCITDEVHALADNKRGTHLSLSLERLSYLSSHMCRVGLSATVAPLEEVARFLVGTDRDCLIIDVQFLKQLDLQVISPVDNLIESEHDTLRGSMYDLIDKLVSEHKTTLIFTNTRSATERVVHFLKEKYPKKYHSNIGAHHGSLSKEIRHNLENRLRKGELKVVVCSTSLELGIDIGYIDLVICLGSPKSVARTLQRVGRSGHRLHDITKGRIIVLDRDDLVECSVLLKSAIEKKIDLIHIPTRALDVLVQQIYGMAVERVWEEKEMYHIIKKSYCYKNLLQKDFDSILSYLSGEYSSLEDRHIYAKIWRKEGKIGRRGIMARVIYMTNVGTIPDTTGILVKLGDHVVGTIDEAFLERLRPGDIFVLGGETYEFKFARGMVAQVTTTVNRPPTVPSWISEMLPLSYDLAMEIGRLRRLILEKLIAGNSERVILTFLQKHLYIDEKSARSIYLYFKEQYDYAHVIPHDQLILIEHVNDERGMHKAVFHSLYGRRVNDCLSRALAFAIGRTQHRDVDVSINDNGFVISCPKKIQVASAFDLLKSEKFDSVMESAIDTSEVLRRRFRHCAGRALMILRTYKGRTRRVGKQHVSSTILLSTIRELGNDFFILREARREVLEDLMDIENAKKVLAGIESKKILIKEIQTDLPSPFAFNLSLMGIMDILRVEDRTEFLRRMHQNIMAKIALQSKPRTEPVRDFSYDNLWKEEEKS